MLFEDNFIVNGDDCLTVRTPAKNIQFRNSYCNGGLGLSIGPLGKWGAAADVQDVLYVVRMLVKFGLLTSPSKDRKCCYGRACIALSDLGFTHLVQENSLYGARFKSWTGGSGIARKYDDSFPSGRL